MNTNNKIGEIVYNKKNEKMTIIAYRCYDDIDVQFEDGAVSYNKTYYNFKIGNIKHPFRYEDSFAYHIEVELGLNLNDIWNWEKNNELDINPYKITRCSDKKVWLYCQEKEYHNYDREGNKIGYKIQCGSFYNNQRCSYCGHNKIHYKDSLAYKYPKIAKMISIPENDLTFEDCYNIACHSKKRFYFECYKCEIISNKKLILNSIVSRGYYSCEKCGDGISIPNKFMYSLLNQLNVKFKSEYSPYYFKNNQHVDFFLKDYNIIIEMDGCFKDRHLIEYDYWRDFLNMKYGGYKTIRIKLIDSYIYTHDKFNYIKNQVLNSELSNLFNLNNINWNLIWEESQKSKCIEAWKLWNNGLHDTKEIGNILNICQSTVTTYLKRGVECKRCDYTVEESKKNGMDKTKGLIRYSRKIICITTGKIFETIKEGAEFYNIKAKSHISDCCNGKRKSCGELEDGTKLQWMYYENFI
jgi:hypothetical protein|nr:MAG TPA_asm: hypothetical protein [Caudoviricetes sp.]